MLDRLRRELATLRASAADPHFSSALLSVIRAWLADRLGVPELATTPPAGLERALREAGVSPDSAPAIGDLARRLEQAGYLPEPVTASERAAWLDETDRLLSAVHVQASRRSWWHLPALGIALLGALAVPPEAWAQAAPHMPAVPRGGIEAPGGTRDAFADGAVAYGRGQFTRAAELLAAYVAAHPDHPDAWYDLGNAEYRARHHGRAVWAWLRALELRPRDGDARQNLALAGVDGSVVDAVSPPVPLSGDELVLVAGLLWLAGASLLLAWRLGGRKSLAGAGGAGIVLAVVVAATGAYAADRPARAVVLTQTAVMGAPNLHADSLAQVNEGDVIEVREQQGSWSRVRAAGALDPTTGERGEAREGWVDAGVLGAL